MIQVISYEIKKKSLTVGFKVDNFVVYSVISYDVNKTKPQLLQLAYQQVKNTIEYEKTLEEHSFTTELEGEEFIPELSKVEDVKLKVDKKYILCDENIEEYQVNLSYIIKDQYGDLVDRLPIYSTSLGLISGNVLLLPKIQEDIEVVLQAELDGISDEIKIYMKPAIDIIPDMPTDVEILQQEISMLREEKLFDNEILQQKISVLREENLSDVEILQQEINILNDENMTLMMASAESYETMYSEDTQVMVAMAEMYEMIMLGGM